MSLSNQDEWVSFLVKNIKNIEEEHGKSEWSKAVLKFIKNEKHNLKTSKIKGEMFFFKYVLDQKQNQQHYKLVSEVEQIQQETLGQSMGMSAAFHDESLASPDIVRKSDGLSFEGDSNKLGACKQFNSEVPFGRDNMRDKHLKLLSIARDQGRR